MLLDHLQCPFCACPGFHGLRRWEHLLTECLSCRALASTRDLQFVPTACASLGLPLDLFTMSHHVASFVKLLMEHLSACHCPQVVPPECRDDTSSIPCEVATADFVVMIQTLGYSVPMVLSSFDIAGGCIELY